MKIDLNKYSSPFLSAAINHGSSMGFAVPYVLQDNGYGVVNESDKTEFTLNCGKLCKVFYLKTNVFDIKPSKYKGVGRSSPAQLKLNGDLRDYSPVICAKFDKQSNSLDVSVMSVEYAIKKQIGGKLFVSEKI